MLGFPTRESTYQSAEETTHKHKVLFIGTRQFWFGLNFILITSFRRYKKNYAYIKDLTLSQRVVLR